MPGFLVAAMTGLLASLPETGVASIAGLTTFAGMMGLGWVHLNDTNPGAWHWLVLFTVLWATGTHLGMPVQASIGMSLAHENKRAPTAWVRWRAWGRSARSSGPGCRGR